MILKIMFSVCYYISDSSLLYIYSSAQTKLPWYPQDMDILSHCLHLDIVFLVPVLTYSIISWFPLFPSSALTTHGTDFTGVE